MTTFLSASSRAPGAERLGKFGAAAAGALLCCLPGFAVTPPLEMVALNRPVDAAGAAMPRWAWGPSIVELADGQLLVAYTASAKTAGSATIEKSDFTALYFTQRNAAGGEWTPPRRAPFDRPEVGEGNPLLFLHGEELWLFYFGVPRAPNGTWPGGEQSAELYWRRSADQGATWSEATLLRAPVTVSATKPVRLANGDIVLPFSSSPSGVLITSDSGKTWRESLFPATGREAAASMPSVQPLPDGRLLAMLRTSRVNHDPARQLLHRSLSADGGRTWSVPEPLPAIRNPNSRLDLVQLPSGELLVVGNDTVRLPQRDGASGRKEINLLLTADLGRTVSHRKTVAKRYDQTVAKPNGVIEWGYPSAILGRDGRTIHFVFGSRNDKRQEQLGQIYYCRVDRPWFERPATLAEFDPDEALAPRNLPRTAAP
ncbi:MAG: exo-alpha-sialidase [Opitutaceae bacterium]|nr:exo-alpha-sialidase [Opitutaceae bacterium]